MHPTDDQAKPADNHQADEGMKGKITDAIDTIKGRIREYHENVDKDRDQVL